MVNGQASVAKQALQAAAFVGLAQAAAMLARPKGASSLAFRLAKKPSWQVPDRAMPAFWIGGFALLGLSAFAAYRGGARSALPLWATYLGGNAIANRLGHDFEHTEARNAASIALLSAYASRAGRNSRAARWLAAPYIAWLAYVALGTRKLRKLNPLLSKLF